MATDKTQAAGQKPLLDDKGNEDTLLQMQQQMLAMAERMAALEEQNAELRRTSREQQTHAAEAMHEERDNDYWEEPGLLSHPLLREPRPGMVQLWVRTHVKGEADGGNVMKTLAKGWVPRAADTLPGELRGTLVVDWNDQQVIGVQGMMLCEMPSALYERQRRQVRSATRHQMQSVEERLRRDFPKQHQGMGRPRFDQNEAHAERGRAGSVIDAD